MTTGLTGTDIESLSYEDAYQLLENVVKTLEAGEQPLEAALELFERGQQLVRHCMSLLDHAELRVKQVTSDGLADLNFEE